MKLEIYLKKLSELEKLPWTEYRQRAAELQAEYLSGQAIPDAASAIEAIIKQLPEMPAPTEKECELLELTDEDSPDERWWRCRVGAAIIDVSAESGEVCLMSV